MAKRRTVPAGQVSADDALKLILASSAPPGLKVAGDLAIEGVTADLRLPDGLTVASLTLDNCPGVRRLPADLRVRRLSLLGNWDPSVLLDGLSVYDLSLRGSAVTALPPTLRVEYRLDLEGCTSLVALPAGLKVGCLILRNCTNLETLPEDLDTYFLDVSGCTALGRWPARGSVGVGRLTARGCAQLRELPPWLGRLAQLDLRDCSNLTTLPEGLEVSSWVDVAGTGITSLPRSMDGVPIRWRGVAVDARIAFLPETIKAADMLAEANVEKRRVMLERMGYERFLTEADAQTLDQDRDPGGPRRLIKVPIPEDEDLVCLSVLCPSTGRQYVLRVPPATTTCHQAAAWIAGFDDPDDYHPLIET
ncbi:MAG TPA: hypothetical protein VK986_00810 [Tepidisphaeraceae bacterium]|nr:hypothetical protein [Tepidisphaeraceae bacterium]